MRYLVSLVCVLALGLMGCSETSGTGGSVACEGGDADICPCSEAGIRTAIEAGEDYPITFDCNGPTTVTTHAEIVIDNDVILDGQGSLTVDGDDDHVVFSVAEGVTAELWGFTVTGGGIYAGGLGDPGILEGCIDNSGILTVTDTTVSGNKVGITNGRILTLINSTVTDNEIWGIGSDDTLVLTNSTVSGNAGEDRNGVSVFEGTVTLLNSTISDNIYAQTPKDEPARTATIVSTATLIDGACVTEEESVVTWTSNGYNIESTGDTCGFDQTSDQPGVTAEQLNLGPLANNGGPTQTHAITTDSAAFDAGTCEVDKDQRGVDRPQGPACDIGAVEWGRKCETDEDCDDDYDCTDDACDPVHGICEHDDWCI